MRPTALALALVVSAAAAQEPRSKPNPFQDGSGTAEPAKPEAIKSAPKMRKPGEAGVGRLVPNVAFTDLAGKAGTLSDFKASKLTVVAFTNTTCPLCKKYAPALARAEKEYGAKGVAFLFVNPTATDKPDGIGFAGRYVHDTDGKLTAALGATTTTEVFVLDAARTVRYRGAIDDQYGLGYALDAPRTRYLAPALDALLAGKQPAVSATTAPGCALEPDAAKAPAVALTYHARIERIVQANCVECHRAGGVAPFGLEKYEDVVAHKAMIAKVVDDRTMPPWFAAPPEKGQHSPFANDRSLTDADKKDLLAWLAGDRKKGDPADAPLPRTFATGWNIGKPDAVFQLPKPVAVKAEGVMPYQNVTVETDFPEDRWVQALEVQPTAREVVHHVLVFAVPEGSAGRGEEQGFFACYVPGNNTLVYPDGYAKKLPKGSRLRFQLHYTPNGKATADQTRIGLVFAKERPRHEVLVGGLVDTRFTIPAGADNHKIAARLPLGMPFPAKLLALFPHAHLRGKAARYELRANGETQLLLDVPRYDFNWQLQYRFAEPVAVPKGSNMTYTAWYDNSTRNPANPDPTKDVRWGPQTFEEMHLGYIEFVIDLPPVAIPEGGVEIPAAFKGFLARFDRDKDGKLTEAEIDALPAVLKGAVLDYVYRNAK